MRPTLIGIHGKMGAGKDTFAKVLQYVALKEKVEKGELSPTLFPSTAILTDNRRSLPLSEYEIRKFADRLKDIICILIGCTKEQLEDQEFKRTKLGPEWKNMTVRQMLQFVGTDMFRDMLSRDTWLNATFLDYTPKSKWIISDLRLENEFEKIKSLGGITVKIVRFLSGEKVYYKAKRWKVEHTGIAHAFLTRKGESVMAPYGELVKVTDIGEHISEKALVYHKFDHVVYNCVEIDHLIEQAEKILFGISEKTPCLKMEKDAKPLRETNPSLHKIMTETTDSP
jgi:hypothetical protein